MLGILVRIAQEFVDYDGLRREDKVSKEDVKLDWLCSQKRGQYTKVVVIDIKSREIRCEDYKPHERRRLYTLPSGRHGIGHLGLLISPRKMLIIKKVKKGLKEIKAGMENLRRRVHNREGKDWIDKCLNELQDEDLASKITEKMRALREL